MKGTYTLLLLWALLLWITSSACSTLDLTPPCNNTCAPDEHCIDHMCVPDSCAQDEDCGPEAQCLDQLCELIFECIMNSDCEEDQRCVEGLCFDNECLEGSIEECMTICGTGERRCVGGVWRACSAISPIDEICEDMIDNDCDDRVDEECMTCEDEERRPCENECGEGEEVCEEGQWAACSAPLPRENGECRCVEESLEVCETTCGLGMRLCQGSQWSECLIDGQLCVCAEGDRRDCMTACGAGEQLCEVEGMEGGWGAWGECQSPDQREEVCFDEIDQDCDGVADEGCEGCMGEVSFLNEQAQIVLGLNADIQSAYVGTYAWIALSRKDQGTPIMLNRLDHAGVANEPNTFRVGIPVSVFDWSGGVGLLSVHQGRLGFSRHSSSDNSALFEEIYMGSNSALNSTIALGNQALYLIWSEVLEELHLQKVNTQGEVIMNSIQLTDAIGRSFQPSAVVSSQGLRIAFVDERDQDPTGWWIYVLEWSPNQPLAPPQSYQFLQGEDPKLLWSRGIYTLVYVLRTQEVSEVRLVQWDQERQVLRAPQVLYRSIGQVQKLKLIPTMEGYQVGWVVYVDQKYHFKVLHTDEDGEPTQEMVHVAELPNQPDYDFAITDSKALVSWTDRYPELEDLLFEPVLKLNAMEITTECLSQVP